MKVEALKQDNIVSGKTNYYIKISAPGHEPVVMVSALSTYTKVKAMEAGQEIPFEDAAKVGKQNNKS